MRSALRHILLTSLFAVVVPGVLGQVPADSARTDTFRVQLPEVTVEAARSTETAASAPFSVSVAERSPAEVALTPGTSLDDVLRPLSGVWVNNRHHFALGERITVRGTGYRSNFGIRGVQIFYDGLPLTLPDGQAFVDVVDPAVVRRVELIRSPASVFWGNGSGGVLFLSSAPADTAPPLRARVQAGSFGRWQGLLESTSRSGPWRFRQYLSGNRQAGYRDHSAGYRLRAGFSAARAIGDDTNLRVLARGDVQDTKNPSSLTLAQFRADPTQADSLFQAANARKQSEQLQLGTTLNHDLGGATLSGTVHYLHRSLDNPLPFGYITYSRNSGDARLTLRRTTGRLTGGVGVDVGAQFDDRTEFTPDRSAVTLNQLETVLGGSGFGYLRLNATDRLAVTGGLRLDGLRFEADDRRLEDGNDSGARTFSAWSPSLGLSYDVGPALVFAHYSTAFETPTAAELSNRPEPGRGGFNQAIDPQRTRGIEIGTRGTVPAANLQFDLALYQQRVDALLNAQRITTGPNAGYQYYTNLGENRHRGLEASLTWSPSQAVEVATRYTGTRFTIQFPDRLSGNRVPGVPPHRGYAHLRVEQNGFWGRLSGEAVSDFAVTDANTVEAPGYVLLDLRLGHTGFRLQNTTLKPFLTVDNLLDERYAASVVVNSGRDFVEPGPSRSFTLGINIAW